MVAKCAFFKTEILISCGFQGSNCQTREKMWVQAGCDKIANKKSLVYQGFHYEWCRGGDMNPDALASGRFGVANNVLPPARYCHLGNYFVELSKKTLNKYEVFVG